MTTAERRAERMLRSYPRVWRDRYGDEFHALLADDLAERPHCPRRDLDVVRAGLAARLSACGLTAGPLRDSAAASAAAAVASVCFAACALSIWTQLADGWLTGPSHAQVVTASLIALSAWLGGLVVVSIIFGLRVAVAVVRTCRSGGGRFLVRPLVTLAASSGVLVAGFCIVAATSPSARGPRRDGVLSHTAALSWAATQTISTFWLHPSRLVALPATNLAWMLICPAAVVAAGWALLRLVRVTDSAAARQHWPAASLVQVLLLHGLAAAAIWVIGSQHAENLNYRAGTLDLGLIAVMAIAAGAVRRAATVTPMTLR
jgi:hypothetical protein